MDQNELPFEPCYLRAPLGTPKMNSEPWYVHPNLSTYLAPRLTLYPNGPKWASIWPTSPRRSIKCSQKDLRAHGIFVANRALIWYRDSHYLQVDQSELPLDPCHLGVPSGAPKMISITITCSAQTVHLSYFDISTISKENKTSFHLTHVT
jgi:hypothetical protein